jgi:replicative DNA helicase
MDFERALLTRMVRDDKAIQQVLKAKVSRKYVFDDDNRVIFSWLLREYEKRGAIPSMGVLKSRFPGFRSLGTRTETGFLIDRLRDRKLYVDLQQGIKRVVAETQSDPKEGLRVWNELGIQLALEHEEHEDVDATKNTSVVVDAYERAKRGGGLLGTPWPWKTLNQCTKGCRDGQYVAFYGAAGSFKTWLLIAIADFFHYDMGEVPAIFTYEMTKEEIQCRHACYRARVDYEQWQDGALSEIDEVRFLDALDDMQECAPFLICEVEESGAAGLAVIRARVQEYGIQKVLLDGLSFVSQDLKWESFGQMNIGVKRMAKATKNPATGRIISVIATHHANRDRKKMVKDSNDALDVALGDTLQRHVDALGRIICEPKHEEEHELVINMRKVREGRRKTFVINAIPATDFSEKFAVGDGTSLPELGVDAEEGGIL